jgi:group II intron reverse transcriptase/maturase
MMPHYDKTFHDSSHGFRPDRSCHTAIAEARRYLEEGREWVVDLDLDRFFDRVHHDRLLARLSARIKDRRLLALIRHMLKAKIVMPDGVVISNEEGTPQGGPLSPLLSNIVLDELDWELARRGHRFVRYADDSNIYVRSERAGQRAMTSICEFIEKRLRLKVNQGKSAVARPEDRHFLGFRLRRNAEDGTAEVLLSKRSKDRIDEKIVHLVPRMWGQSLKDCIQRLNRYLEGWVNFFSICTAAESRTFVALDRHIRRRLRAIVFRHWRRRRTMLKALIHLGVREKMARYVFSRRNSLWALSISKPAHFGLRNAFFADRGLVSICTQWELLNTKRSVTRPAQLSLTLDS